MIEIQCLARIPFIASLLSHFIAHREPERKTFYGQTSFFSKILVPSFLPVLWHKKHINQHIIIISDGCISFIMNCAATIFTTYRIMETLIKTMLNLVQNTLKCLSIGTSKIINFPFVSNGK